jgi:predicted ABC-type ATPase
MPRKTPHPNYYIIPGPNGAGKATFATEFLPIYANCRNSSIITPDYHQ